MASGEKPVSNLSVRIDQYGTARLEDSNGEISIDIDAMPEATREAICSRFNSHPAQTEALKECQRELKNAHEFFSHYVPLVDHNGQSLYQDWSWGPAQAALDQAEAVLEAESSK